MWSCLCFVVLQIYDRDGLTLGEFVKGDMYIRDLKNTKGHISGLTWGEWHPRTKETILTSSEDGSLRIWDVNNFKTQKQVSILLFSMFLLNEMKQLKNWILLFASLLIFLSIILVS